MSKMENIRHVKTECIYMYIPKLPLGARGYHSYFVFRICDHEHNENQIPRRKKKFVSAKIKQKMVKYQLLIN